MSDNTVNFMDQVKEIWNKKGANEIVELIKNTMNASPANFPGIEERLESFETEYHIVLDYYAKGVKDDQRQDIVLKLWRKLEGIILSVQSMILVHDNPVFRSAAIRSRSFDEFSISERTKKYWAQEEKGQFLEYCKSLFSFVLASGPWNDDRMALLKQHVLSEDANSIVAALIVSAATLAFLADFDPYKSQFLQDVYLTSNKMEIRERAFVGWALSIPQMKKFPITSASIGNNQCWTKAVRRELLDLQKQIFFCMDAEKDSATVSKKYMPNLMKQMPKHFPTLDMQDEPPLEDILHPEAEEERMETIERYSKEMNRMEKEGSDVFYGGFSHMKSFGFFHTLCNWFLPYFPENPALLPLVNHLGGDDGILQKLDTKSPFCDSDRYSFCFVFTNLFEHDLGVVSQLNSDKLKAMLKSDILFSRGNQWENEEEKRVFVRRLYLQDVYRFFRLAPMRESFPALFVENENGQCPAYFLESIPYVDEQAREEDKMNICRFLTKRKDYDRLVTFYSLKEDNPTQEELLFNGLCLLHVGNYSDAEYYLNLLYQQNDTHVGAIQLLMRCYTESQDFKKACDLCKRLIAVKGESFKLNLRLAYLLIQAGDYTEATQLLFKLEYEKPGCLDVQRPLVWALLKSKQPEKALSFINKFDYNDEERKDKKAVAEDLYNKGLCMWALGQVAGAVEAFEGYLEYRGEGPSLASKFAEDCQLLADFNVPETERYVMCDSCTRNV